MATPEHLADTFVEFAHLLSERLKAGVRTTEDSVRYTFYSALNKGGKFSHTEIVFEYPHPKIPGAEIDTLLQPRTGQSAAIEFKYDRGNKGGTNQNRTQRAGSALADVFRLVKVPTEVAVNRYFVYVTDGEMAGYFKNPNNRLHQFFTPDSRLALNASLFAEFAQTFRARVDALISDCEVHCAFAADLPGDHCVRVWHVLPSNILSRPTALVAAKRT